ncbi:uncharacterized protein LOC120843536 [Ixodes scapularis]|uniref:uncharacterized protein LOC120843536 n=1 Tax=Ixodes scapularis TaxID=6945 RepID=UPI001AD722BD|nr:uncharacterized protein LOC120843536 [Ixodes scapularis]
MWGTTPSKLAGIHWNQPSIKYLGVPLDQARNSGLYWTSVATNIKRKIDAWRVRNLSIFTKAAVCNIFLTSKLMYGLQVLHCARPRIQAFHRLFATFIWSSSWERMRRDNLFLPLECGGLGLAHLFVRQLVSRLFFFRNIRHPLLASLVQTKLASHLPFLIVSTTDDVSCVLRGFWKEVVDTLLFLNVRFSLEYLFSVSRKCLSQALVENFFPLPIYRSRFNDSPGQDVLKRVKKMCVSPTAKTFFFQLHTSTLPVKAWLQERGFFVPWSINCRLCNKPETIEHRFIYCNDAVYFWDVLQRTLKKDIDFTEHSIRFLPVEQHGVVPYDLFMLLGLHSLWKCRMIDRNAEQPRTTRSLFIEEVAKVRSVYEARPPVPDWFSLFDACLNLPHF